MAVIGMNVIVFGLYPNIYCILSNSCTQTQMHLLPILNIAARDGMMLTSTSHHRTDIGPVLFVYWKETVFMGDYIKQSQLGPNNKPLDWLQ